MSSTLIPTSGSGLTPLKTIKATRAQRQAEVAVFQHRLETAVMTELDRQDSQAIADVLTTATEEELRFLDYGLALAGNSTAKTELVARKVNLMSNINNQRIARRFGR